jgi:putative endonuclease
VGRSSLPPSSLLSTSHARTSGTIRDRSSRATLGAAAEDAVADYLRARGLDVIARNVRVGRLEIDLIARDGPVIVIVEVRTRGPSSYQRAFDSIDARKRARIRRAGESLWRTRFASNKSLERMRFDVASVTFTPDGEPVVEHVRAAF